jgi:hypothetical protein
MNIQTATNDVLEAAAAYHQATETVAERGVQMPARVMLRRRALAYGHAMANAQEQPRDDGSSRSHMLMAACAFWHATEATAPPGIVGEREHAHALIYASAKLKICAKEYGRFLTGTTAPVDGCTFASRALAAIRGTELKIPDSSVTKVSS